MLSPVINPSNFSSAEELIEKAYIYFQEKIMDRQTRDNFRGKFIFVDEKNWVEDKLDFFWHIVGLSEADIPFEIFPCTNDFPTYSLCGENCETKEWSVQTKTKLKIVCLYRAIRILWICDVLKLANNNDSNIKVWVKEDRIFIRYLNNMDDYVVILEKLKKSKEMYKLVTAYPVFYRDQKRNFKREHEKFLKK